MRNWRQRLLKWLQPQSDPGGANHGPAPANATDADYIALLIELLRAEVESNSDPQVVYPLLGQHQDRLDLTFAETVKLWFQGELNPNDSEKNQFLARTLYNFAIDISNFPLGSRANNLEKAIACYEAALEVRTRPAFPENWATTQNNLGIAYCDRLRGERADNLEMAIACYQAALEVYTRPAFPQDWARTQNNLGNAYQNRLRGERADNLEMAIACYQAALEVYTRQAFPENWATTQNNLGIVYRNRLRGERADNLEMAIACYQAALEVYTRPTFPQDWAMTQNNLGIAYCDRLRGERAENLEMAIACYQAALEVYTRQAFPQNWAMTQNNLGYAYQTIEQNDAAIRAYQAALEVRTPKALPLDCLQTGRNLGNLAYDLQNWETAIQGYDNAIRAVEQSRNWATSPQTKRELLENALPIYGKMVQACINLQDCDRALLTVERGKTRIPIELLHQANLEPKNATPDQLQRYRQLRRDIAALQQTFPDSEPLRDRPTPGPGRQTAEPATTANPQQTQLQTLLQQREDLLAEIDDPDFNALQVVPPQLPDFRQLLTPETALIEWYLPQDPDLGGYAFILTLRDRHHHIQLHSYSPQQRQLLDEFNETYFSDFREPGWYDRLDTRLDDLAQHLDLCQLLAKIPSTCNTLILVPHFYLHLFPLHALVEAERFSEGVRYVPSCQIWEYLQNRRQPATTSHFFAIENPTRDLPYTEVEVETIRQSFDPNTTILKNEAANKAAFTRPQTLAQLRRSRFVHFSCHGGFNSANPLNSALLLAGDAPPNPDPRCTLTLRDGRRFDIERQGLTLREIYANLELPACRLVALSACETGLLESQLTDEYVGLASGFLYAGSPTVVSSFWCVDDFATAFLTIRFYRELTPETTIAKALKNAQTWMRTVSKADFLTWCETDLNISEDRLIDCTVRLLYYPNNPPFADKRYWSAFGAIGL